MSGCDVLMGIAGLLSMIAVAVAGWHEARFRRNDDQHGKLFDTTGKTNERLARIEEGIDWIKRKLDRRDQENCE